MSTGAPGAVEQHYADVLAPVYLWMAGGIEAALVQGTVDIGPLGPPSASGAVAVDLGAGFGMHAIPLARAGYVVTAIDSSPLLLDTLRVEAQATGAEVRCTLSELTDFRRHVKEPADVIVCMGDTLTHLPDEPAVGALLREVVAGLAPHGQFVATFRDYTSPPTGDARFIAVRSDADRIHTCFLEVASETHMRVHDLVHERDGEGWRMKLGSYPKLRLAPARVAELARAAGLAANVERGARGLWRLSARRDGA
jgi:SAM-dependent methyltransferase